MTAVIYARYSSSSQREASIEEWQIDYKNIKNLPAFCREAVKIGYLTFC